MDLPLSSFALVDPDIEPEALAHTREIAGCSLADHIPRRNLDPGGSGRAQVLHDRREDGTGLVSSELHALLALGKAGRRDFITIASFLNQLREIGYFNLATLKHEQLKDPQFEGRLWEARLLRWRGAMGSTGTAFSRFVGIGGHGPGRRNPANAVGQEGQQDTPGRAVPSVDAGPGRSFAYKKGASSSVHLMGKAITEVLERRRHR